MAIAVDTSPIYKRRNAFHELEPLLDLEHPTGKRLLTQMVTQGLHIPSLPMLLGDLTGWILDTETTGLPSDPEAEIIELGIIALDFSRSPTRLRYYSGLREPAGPLSEKIQAITGLHDHDLAGKTLDYATIQALPTPVFIVAHNAAFDREMVERLPALNAILMEGKPTWLCSQRDYDWAADGAPSQSLEMLAWAHHMVPQPHRALNDAWTLLNLVNQCRGEGEPSYLERIIDHQHQTREARFIVDPGGSYLPDFRQACIDAKLWRDARSGTWSKLVHHGQDAGEWDTDWWPFFQQTLPAEIRERPYASYFLQEVPSTQRYTSLPLTTPVVELDMNG